MVGAKIKSGVDQGNLFGIEEDLPPKRKPQFVAHPELLIEIPESLEEEKADFDKDLMDIEVKVGDYPNWQQILDSFHYETETEITKVEIKSVEALTLDGSKFREIHDPPAIYRTGKRIDETTDPAQLAELLKNSVRDLANDLLAEEGIGTHELGYFYGVLICHVSKQMLAGKTVGAASAEELRHALNRRHRMAANFKATPGLVASIVKYRKEARHAGL
jgi:hypothetical protein